MASGTNNTGLNMTLMRLQKFLSSAGHCSRRKGESLIEAGKVKVNGKQVTTLGTKVDPETDHVSVGGKELRLEEKIIYIALNKPRGFVTTCHQPKDKIVLDLVDIPQRVFPVGRLDKDSTGLLIMTNDGRLHHQLSHPSFDHEKEYEVGVKMPVSDEDLGQMAAGMTILGSKTRPAKVKRTGPKKFVITLKEGRNRQIRRMVEAVGNQVVTLKRVRIAGLMLGRLKSGTWRFLTEKEIKNLWPKAP